MDSAGLRRTRSINDIQATSSTSISTNGLIKDPTKVPRYTIDLSLPPVKRYQHVALEFKSKVADLPALFDELARECVPNISVSKVKMIARLALRHVYNKEENEELRGLSEATGIAMWLLVSHNVLLDTFMGCTSGGVRVDHNGSKSRMLHFRTLDWGMDPLRKTIIHLDFVEKAGGEVIASSITHFGFVGVLTGVRKGLSMSLNFRPTHNKTDRLADTRFYSHLLLVLLGFRPSIGSVLRRCLIPSQTTSGSSRLHSQTLDELERTLPGMISSAAYIILSDGKRTTVMEKDIRSGVVRSSGDFIAATNHDAAHEDLPSEESPTHELAFKARETAGIEDIVEESVSRKCAIVSRWEEYLGTDRGDSPDAQPLPRQVLRRKTIVDWLEQYPVTNEQTHFATIMDPRAGKLVWLKRHLEPVIITQ